MDSTSWTTWPAGRVHAELYVFLTAWSPLAGPAAAAPGRHARQPAHLVLRPGLSGARRTSLDAMRELTGFRMKRVSGVQARPSRRPWAAGWASQCAGDCAAAAAVVCRGRRVCRRNPGDLLRRFGRGRPARPGGERSLFVGPPGLSSELLRLAARHAKVHLFTQADCNVYANGPYLVLHASQDGPLEIDTGRAGPIRDVLTGQTIGDGPKLLLSAEER